MVKKKISKRPEASLKGISMNKLKKSKELIPFSSADFLKDKKFIANALWECLVDDDIESFKEILRTHLEYANKDELAKKAGVSRRTLFRMLSPEGNPTLANLGKIIHELCA